MSRAARSRKSRRKCRGNTSRSCVDLDDPGRCLSQARTAGGPGSGARRVHPFPSALPPHLRSRWRRSRCCPRTGRPCSGSPRGSGRTSASGARLPRPITAGLWWAMHVRLLEIRGIRYRSACSKVSLKCHRHPGIRILRIVNETEKRVPMVYNAVDAAGLSGLLHD
jgi:hypothetical protein